MDVASLLFRRMIATGQTARYANKTVGVSSMSNNNTQHFMYYYYCYYPIYTVYNNKK